MKSALLVLGLAIILTPASALIPPGAADEKTGEGWQAVGFPIDDYVPWNLWLQAKEIAAQDRKYLVVAGYLVASPNSVILFPNEEASRSGRTDGLCYFRVMIPLLCAGCLVVSAQRDFSQSVVCCPSRRKARSLVISRRSGSR
jgi:hypothetical protein